MSDYIMSCTEKHQTITRFEFALFYIKYLCKIIIVYHYRKKEKYKLTTKNYIYTGGGKSGGGTQGRESKTKATKKKYMKGRGNQGDDSDDDTSVATSTKPGEIEFLSMDEIGEHLKKFEALAECDEEFIAEIATQLYRYGDRLYSTGKIAFHVRNQSNPNI